MMICTIKYRASKLISTRPLRPTLEDENGKPLADLGLLSYRTFASCTRVRVMGSYPEIVAKPNICVTENQRRRCASAIRARPAFVLGPVDIPP